jgi:hypothetical protein
MRYPLIVISLVIIAISNQVPACAAPKPTRPKPSHPTLSPFLCTANMADPTPATTLSVVNMRPEGLVVSIVQSQKTCCDGEFCCEELGGVTFTGFTPAAAKKISFIAYGAIDDEFDVTLNGTNSDGVAIQSGISLFSIMQKKAPGGGTQFTITPQSAAGIGSVGSTFKTVDELFVYKYNLNSRTDTATTFLGNFEFNGVTARPSTTVGGCPSNAFFF